jgi:replication factor A2
MSAYSDQNGAGSSNNAGMSYAHLPPLQRKIIECILGQPRRDDGVHVAAIARNVREDAHKIRYVHSSFSE